LYTIVIKTARFALTEKTVDSVLTPPSPIVRLVGKWVIASGVTINKGIEIWMVMLIYIIIISQRRLS